MISEVRKKAEKRSTEIIIFAVILAAGTAATTYNNTNILDAGASSSDGLVAEYQFDTGAGSTAYDTAGNNEGTINGASWTSGVKSGALKFDGSEDVRSRETGALDLKEEITISSWVRWQGGGVKWHGIVSKGNSQPYGLTLNSPNKFAHFEWARSGCGQRLDTQANSVETGTWEHIVATYDRNKMRIYVDGELEAESSLSDCSPSTTDQKLRIGQGNNGEYFKGKLDTTRIYSEALDHSQIKSLYNRGSWRIGTTTKEDDPSKVLDISFQHQNNTHVYDTSGYENHGDIFGNARQSDAISCKVGRCYNFDGTSGTGVDLNNIWSDHTESRTFMFWFKEAESGASNNDRIISQDCSEWFCLVDKGFDRIEFGFDGFSKNPSISLNQNKWHHFTVVFNESGSNVAIYLDGRKRYESSYSPSWSHLARPVVLGGNTEGTDDISGSEWEGKIDQLKIFNRSLTQQEIVEKTQGLDSGGAVLDLRFNQDGGNLAEDSSGASNEGRIISGGGSRPKRVGSVDGNAIELGGDGDAVDIPSSTSIEEALSGEEATIAFWVDLGEISGSYNTWFPWTATNNQGSQSARLEHEGNGDNIYTRWIVDPASAGFREGDGGAWSRGLPDMRGKRFLHVSTFETTKSGYRVRTYINDEIASESTSSEKAVLAEASNVGSFSPSQVPSTIDNLQIYPYALTPDKVEELHDKGTSSVGDTGGTREGLVLSQTFNRIETCGRSDTITCPSGASGKIAVDESGEANHGELINSPEVAGPEECIVGRCIRSTESSRIQDEDPSNLPESDSARTLSGWFKMTDTDKAGVFGYGKPNTNEGFQFYTPNGLGDELQVDFWGTNEGGVDDVIPSIKEKWYHVAATYDGNTITVYRNGQKIDSASYTGLNTNSERFVAGAKLDRNDEFEGLYDQIKVFDRSLSEKQIWKLYTQGRDKEDGMAGPIAHYRFDAGKVGTENNPADSCLQIKNLRSNPSSGTFWVTGYEGDPKNKFKAYCDMDREGGGWTRIWFKQDQTDGYGFVACESSKWNPKWSTNPVVDLDPDCDQDFSEHKGASVLHDLTHYDEDGNIIPESQIREFSERVNLTVYNSSFRFYDADNNCNDNREPVTAYDNSAPSGNSVNVLPSRGNPAEDSSHVVCGGGDSGTTQTVSGSWHTIMDNGIPTDFGLQSGSGDTGCWKCSGYNRGYGSTVEFKATYFWVKESKSSLSDISDSSGEENSGEIVGNPKWVEGKIGKALKFDGSDDYVVSQSKTGISGEDSRTITGWFRVDSFSTDDSWSVPFSIGDDQTDELFEPLIDNDEEDLHWHVWGTNPQMASIKGGKWHHFALTYDGSEVKAYLDGELKDTNSISLSTEDREMRIGQSWSNDRELDGAVDDVRIYPYALNGEQVKKVMNGGAVSVG